jgi:HEAT repeat protein
MPAGHLLNTALESYPYLVELTRDPMPPVRIAALEALSGLNSQAALDAVLPFLKIQCRCAPGGTASHRAFAKVSREIQDGTVAIIYENH